MKSHHVLGRLLTGGITLSAICLVVGLILSFLDRGMGHARSSPLIDLGLIMLMVTPLVRVLFSLSEEIRERNWFFATSAIIVVIVLAAAFVTALVSS